jgi:hypothetical protein
MAEYISPNDVLLDVAVQEGANGSPYDCAHRKFAGAIAVLGRLFGLDWLDSHVLADKAKAGGAFIHPTGSSPFDQFKMGDRVVTLAEHLVNLQEIDGFAFCLDELRTDKIEPSYAKLIAAGILQRRSIPFRIVVPSQKKGRDYDAEAIIGAASVPIEMKAKVEGNELSASSIRNSLRRARKQLPRGAPNIVFLRVPESWAQAEAGRQQIMAAVLKEFTDSGSIGVVVVHYERWYNPPDAPGWGERRHRLMIVSNGAAHAGLSALEDALLAIPENLEEIPWTTFERLLCADLKPVAGEAESSAHQDTLNRFPEIDDLTVLGPVQLQYAHLCQKEIRNPEGPTWQRIRQRFLLPKGAQTLPSECDLVIGLIGRGRFREGRYAIRIPFGKEGQGGQGTFHRELIDFRRLCGKDSPVLARLTLNVAGLKIEGPGIYYFDFLVENQWVGRLPIVIASDEWPDGTVNRGALRRGPVDLEFGHIVQDIDPPRTDDPEQGYSLKGVVDGFGRRDPGPFRVPPLFLIVGLTAAGDTHAEHELSVRLLDSKGNALSTSTGEAVTLQPFLPGSLFSMRGFALGNLACPGPGQHEFEVSIGGKAIGYVGFSVFVVDNK